MTVIGIAGRCAPWQLWLVRHGESTWNAIGRAQRGITHPPLTPRGVVQAHAAAVRLRDEHIASIVTSDALRAVQTANAIAAQVGAPVRADRRLRERGHLDAHAVDGRVLAATRTGENPGGLENPRERVERVLGDLARNPVPTVLVTHGDIICAMLDLMAARDETTVLWTSGGKVPNGVILPLRVNPGRRLTARRLG